MLRQYTGGQLVHVPKTTGLVSIKERRSPAEIAKDWSDNVFSDQFSAGKYTTHFPLTKSRHFLVAETLGSEIGPDGKAVVDFGAGEGQLLKMMPDAYHAVPFGVEPSAANCAKLNALGIESFQGTCEDYHRSDASPRFDVAYLTWTLCNIDDCVAPLVAAFDVLKPGEHLLIAESSRMRAPFKKPLHYYLQKNVKTDLHPWHFSANTLRALFALTGFEIACINRYLDQDSLIIIGRKPVPSAACWTRHAAGPTPTRRSSSFRLLRGDHAPILPAELNARPRGREIGGQRSVVANAGSPGSGEARPQCTVMGCA